MAKGVELMRSSQVGLISCTFAMIFLSACSKTETNYSKVATPALPVAVPGLHVVAGPLQTKGNDIIVLDTNCTITSAPAYGYRMDIHNLNLRKLNERFRKGTVSGTNVVAPFSNADDGVSGGHFKSRWDLNLKLNPGERALIRVKLHEGKFKFRDNGLAITAGDADSAKTLCGLQKISDTEYYVYAQYDATATVGSFNIGIVVEDQNDNTRSLPIQLDPNIKNHG